jgi:hypothetical protein
LSCLLAVDGVTEDLIQKFTEDVYGY